MVAAFNVGLFMFFLLSFLKPGGSDEWRSMGVVTAFLVAPILLMAYVRLARFEERKATQEFGDVYRTYEIIFC